MRKGPSFLNLFLAVLVVVSLFHLFIQLSFYGSGIGGLAEKGISGFAVTEPSDSGGAAKSLTSKAILLAEWGLILLGMIFVYTKHRIDMKREFEDLKSLKDKKHFASGTELDNVYELLTDVGHFRLSNGARLFNVKEDIMEDWAKTLEASDLADLAYPRIGGPELRLRAVNIKKEGFFKNKNLAK